MEADTQDLSVGIEAGDGMVARFGDTVVLVAPVTGDDEGSVADLLDLVAAAAAAERPGTAIATALGGWLAARPPADETAFGLVAPVPDGIVVFLRGAVWCEVTESGSTRTLSGRRTLTWTDQVVPGAVERVVMGTADHRPVRVHARSDLRAGSVPGSGFVLAPATVDDRSPSEPALVSDTAPLPVPATRAEPPVAARTLPPSAAPAGAPSTPRAPARETAMAPLPIGSLSCAEGPTIPLDRAYVLGRDPHNDPAVRAAAASPITLPDPDNLISRVHVHLAVEDGAVLVRDAPSVSGTFIAAPGDDDWTRVGPAPTPLPPGWSLRIGARVFVYEPTAAAGPA